MSEPPLPRPQSLAGLAAQIDDEPHGVQRLEMLEEFARVVAKEAEDELLHIMDARYWSGKTISESLGISRQAVYQRAHRARQRREQA